MSTKSHDDTNKKGALFHLNERMMDKYMCSCEWWKKVFCLWIDFFLLCSPFRYFRFFRQTVCHWARLWSLSRCLLVVFTLFRVTVHYFNKYTISFCIPFTNDFQVNISYFQAHLHFILAKNSAFAHKIVLAGCIDQKEACLPTLQLKSKHCGRYPLMPLTKRDCSQSMY